MKLSKTQAELLKNIRNTLEVVKKYAEYEDFFDNSRFEQSTFNTGARCNSLYNTAEKYKTRDAKQFARQAADWNLAKEQNIIIVFAKTETVNALARAGYIKIIEHAQYKGDAETIQLINQEEV